MTSAASPDAALVLPAAGPDEWLATHLREFATHDEHRTAEDPPSVWRPVQEMLADDAAALGEVHARLVHGGSAADVAAVAVLGWVVGPLAAAIGFTYAFAAAALRCDGQAARVRFHPRGWPDAVDVGSPVLAVTAGHPWAGRSGVEVLAADDATIVDDIAVAEAAVTGLVELAEPVVEACRRMAAVGRVGLWNEVGDAATGNVVAYDTSRPVSVAVITRLGRLAASPSAPWRSRGSVWIASASFGPAYVARRGGCCLAYRDVAGDPGPDGPWCGSCSLRSREVCERVQLDWMEHERRGRS